MFFLRDDLLDRVLDYFSEQDVEGRIQLAKVDSLASCTPGMILLAELGAVLGNTECSMELVLCSGYYDRVNIDQKNDRVNIDPDIYLFNDRVNIEQDNNLFICTNFPRVVDAPVKTTMVLGLIDQTENLALPTYIHSTCGKVALVVASSSSNTLTLDFKQAQDATATLYLFFDPTKPDNYPAEVSIGKQRIPIVWSLQPSAYSALESTLKEHCQKLEVLHQQQTELLDNKREREDELEEDHQALSRKYAQYCRGVDESLETLSHQAHALHQKLLKPFQQADAHQQPSEVHDLLSKYLQETFNRTVLFPPLPLNRSISQGPQEPQINKKYTPLRSLAFRLS